MIRGRRIPAIIVYHNRIGFVVFQRELEINGCAASSSHYQLNLMRVKGKFTFELLMNRKMHLGFLSQFGTVICVGIFLGEYQRSQDCCNRSVSSEWIRSF